MLVLVVWVVLVAVVLISKKTYLTSGPIYCNKTINKWIWTFPRIHWHGRTICCGRYMIWPKMTSCFVPKSRQMSGLIMSTPEYEFVHYWDLKKRKNRFVLSPQHPCLTYYLFYCGGCWLDRSFFFCRADHTKSQTSDGRLIMSLGEDVYSVAGVQIRTIQERLTRRSEAFVEAVGAIF
jgi:hypothetical protein